MSSSITGDEVNYDHFVLNRGCF